MKNLSTRSKLILLVVASALPALALILFNTIEEREAAKDNARADLVRLSASFGVALFPDHASDADTLLLKADEALYQAKGAGRDRVMVSPSASGSIGAPDERALEGRDR